MNKKIMIEEHKKLILKQVINQSLNNVDLGLVDIEISKFMNQIQTLKVKTFGPLIIRSKGLHMSEEGKIGADYDLYIQADDYKQYKNQWDVLDEVIVEHCLYTRFDGKPEHVELAFDKLSIYEYEENLVTTGDTYMITLEDTQNHIVMDIFKPVKRL